MWHGVSTHIFWFGCKHVHCFPIWAHGSHLPHAKRTSKKKSISCETYPVQISSQRSWVQKNIEASPAKRTLSKFQAREARPKKFGTSASPAKKKAAPSSAGASCEARSRGRPRSLGAQADALQAAERSVFGGSTGRREARYLVFFVPSLWFLQGRHGENRNPFWGVRFLPPKKAPVFFSRLVLSLFWTVFGQSQQPGASPFHLADDFLIMVRQWGCFPF